MKKVIIILSFFFLKQTAFAQNESYHGGIADGHAGDIIFTFSQGNYILKFTPYRGGNADGYSADSLVAINQGNYILKFAPYRGGNSDGYKSDSLNSFNALAYIGKFNPYAGGIADGHAGQPFILVNSISGYAGCGDSTFAINFFVNAQYNAGNSFTAQLSDTSGNFGSPLNIGVLNSLLSGTVNCNIPGNLPQSNKYRVRVNSSNPGTTGYGYPITISTKPNLGADTTLFIVCSGETLNISNLYNTTGLTSLWNIPNPLQAPAGRDSLIVTSSYGCKDTAVVIIQQDVTTWTGTISNDWFNAGNWNTNRIPNEKTHVIINGSTPNNCIVNSSPAKAASLQVRNGAIFTVIIGNDVSLFGLCNPLPPGP